MSLTPRISFWNKHVRDNASLPFPPSCSTNTSASQQSVEDDHFLQQLDLSLRDPADDALAPHAEGLAETVKHHLLRASGVFLLQPMQCMGLLMALVMEIPPAICLPIKFRGIILTFIPEIPGLRPLKKTISEQSKSTQRYHRLLKDFVCRVRISNIISMINL